MHVFQKISLPKKTKSEEPETAVEESENENVSQSPKKLEVHSCATVEIEKQIKTENKEIVSNSKCDDVNIEESQLSASPNKPGKLNMEADSSLCKIEKMDTTDNELKIENECTEIVKTKIATNIETVAVDSTQGDEVACSSLKDTEAVDSQVCQSELETCSKVEMCETISISKSGSIVDGEKLCNTSESVDPDSTKMETNIVSFKSEIVKESEQADSCSLESASVTNCTSSTDGKVNSPNKEVNSSVSNKLSIVDMNRRQSEDIISNSTDVLKNEDLQNDMPACTNVIPNENTLQSAQTSNQKLSDSLVDSTTLSVKVNETVSVSSSSTDYIQDSKADHSEHNLSNSCESSQFSTVSSNETFSSDLVVSTNTTSEGILLPMKEALDECVDSMDSTSNGCSVNSTSIELQPAMPSLPAKKKVS